MGEFVATKADTNDDYRSLIKAIKAPEFQEKNTRMFAVGDGFANFFFKTLCKL